MPNGPRAAIVTTLTDAELVIDSFISYHLSIGFDHLFLFFDDPADPSFHRAAKYSKVTAIKRDHSLRRAWEQSRLYAEDETLRQFVDSEVMARQELNAGISARLALENNIDWLLHIDVDELFYLSSRTVQEHFKSLGDRNIERAIYLNYEAIPERIDIEDYLKEVTLFKRAPRALSGGFFNHAQIDLINSMPELPATFFLYYGNGKQAGRVSEQLLPLGVHAFRPSGSSTEEMSTDAVILHYPCCGFEHFWRKYKTLGKFNDKWFDRVDIAAAGNTFHLEARDVVASDDRAAALAFYQKRVQINDEQRIAALLSSGLCCRIDGPSRLISEKLTRDVAQDGIL